MQQRYRIVREIVDANGRAIVSDWIETDLTTSDRARVESRFNQIELNETENPKWLTPYRSLKMWEIRVDSGGKAIRFLCERDEDDVILVIGCVKRGQIKSADEARARQRRDEYRKGELNVRDYPLPQRPPNDVEEPR